MLSSSLDNWRESTFSGRDDVRFDRPANVLWHFSGSFDALETVSEGRWYVRWLTRLR